MTPLRAKMIQQMQLQRFAPSTQDAYMRAIAGLLRIDTLNRKPLENQ